MKNLKFHSIAFLMFTFFLFSDYAMAKTFGLGAVIGAPTGLSANYFFRPNQSIHTTLAYDLSGEDDLQFASHYTWRRNTLRIENVNFGWFYGFGAKLAVDKHDHHHHKHDHDHDDGHVHLGPGGTLGLFHEFKSVPLEVFLKGNLTVNILEHTGVDGDLMLGLHYNF